MAKYREAICCVISNMYWKVVFFHSNTQVMQTSGMVVRDLGSLENREFII